MDYDNQPVGVTVLDIFCLDGAEQIDDLRKQLIS
jgi:hypothetical protein